MAERATGKEAWDGGSSYARQRPEQTLLYQLIRAERSAALGLVRVLDVEGARVTGEMVAALQRLALQRRPSTAAVPGLLAGLDTINRRLRPWLSHGEADPATAAVTA